MILFNDDQYTIDSTYIFNDGSYAKFNVIGPKKNIVIKDGTTGGIIFEGPSSFAATPKNLIEESLSSRFDTVLSSTGITLELKEIIPPPPKEVKKFSSFIRIKGKIIDKNTNDPLSNAKASIKLLTSVPLPSGNEGFVNKEVSSFEEIESNQTNFDEFINTVETALSFANPAITDEKGVFEWDYAIEEEDGDVNFERSTVDISKNEYFSKTISSLQFSELITIKSKNFNVKNDILVDDIQVQVYNLGRLSLDPKVLDVEKEVQVVNKKIEEQERKIVAVKSLATLPYEIKMAIVFDSTKERLKQTLIPAIFSIISTFGPEVVKSIANKKLNPLKNKTCPPKEDVLKALRKRNKLVKELNNIYKVVRRISKVLGVAEALILGSKIGLTTAQAASNIPFLLAAYGPIIEKGFKKIDKLLEKVGIGLRALSLTAATVGMLLGVIIELLNSLDFLIQSCAEEEEIPFIELNSEFNDLINGDNSNPQGILDVIDPLTKKPYPYKGFSFEIEVDSSQNFQYPKRYAIARNIQGIQVLRSESSFASSPEILIEELKFVIDKNNLRAD